MWKREEIAWAAGLFEGEGHLGYAHSSRTGSPRLYLQSTDRDVVLKFSNAVKIGRFVDKPHAPQGLGKKPFWKWHCSGFGRVQALLVAFLPWLGERRGAKAVELIKHGKTMGFSGRQLRYINELRSHCAKGHELTIENVYRHPRGSRECRACRKQYFADRFQRKQVAKAGATCSGNQ